MYKFFFVLVVLFLSCSDSLKTLSFDCEEYSAVIDEYTFYLADLVVDPSTFVNNRVNVEVADGTNLVFEYFHQDEDCLTVIDDESSSKIRFELDPLTEYIHLVDEELAQVNCIYTRIAQLGVSFEIREGELEARKISDNQWEVDFKTDIDQFNIDKQIRIKEEFSKK